MGNLIPLKNKHSHFQYKDICIHPMFHPWVGKIPWRRAWQPTPVFMLENPMERGA